MSRSICAEQRVGLRTASLARWAESRVACANRLEFQTERRQLLPEMIVQIPGDPASLLLLGNDQSPQQADTRLFRIAKLGAARSEATSRRLLGDRAPRRLAAIEPLSMPVVPASVHQVHVTHDARGDLEVRRCDTCASNCGPFRRRNRLKWHASGSRGTSCEPSAGSATGNRTLRERPMIVLGLLSEQFFRLAAPRLHATIGVGCERGGGRPVDRRASVVLGDTSYLSRSSVSHS